MSELSKLTELFNQNKISRRRFITHDLATVKAIADKIVIMLEGKIIEQGEKKQVLSPPIMNTQISFWHPFRKWIRTGLIHF
jgi:ABC-type microcin C transport system duplicated ATPase subunit YejF